VFPKKDILMSFSTTKVGSNEIEEKKTKREREKEQLQQQIQHQQHQQLV